MSKRSILISKYRDSLTTRRSLPDARDYLYGKLSEQIQPKVDLREWDSPIEDQYLLGSCIGNAIANAYEIMTNLEAPDQFVELSRLYIYYNSRLYDNTVNEDVGATMRDGIRATKEYGVCKEELWPYDVTKFNVKPTQECYDDGSTRTIKNYRRVQDTREVLDALSNYKPVVIGVEVFEDFLYLDETNSVIEMPDIYEPSIGGHAMTIIGYDVDRRQYLVKNSFGSEWGDAGYCWMPFRYLTMYGFDNWIFDIHLLSSSIIAD